MEKEKNILKIQQKTLFGIKGKIDLQFEGKGVKVNGKYNSEKFKDDFHEYQHINISNTENIKNSEQYYLLVGILFGLYGFFTASLFFLLFFLIFMYLYYKSIQNVIMLGYSFYILNDKKADKIINEIQQRRIPIRKENEYKIYEYSNREDEKKRLEALYKEGIIIESEFNSIIKELEKYIFHDEKNTIAYLREREMISVLLEEKGKKELYELQDIVYEGHYLPNGIQSISGIIYFSEKERYSFWLNWDKNIENPNDKQKGYYTLGDSEGIVSQFGRSFFKKL